MSTFNPARVVLFSALLASSAHAASPFREDLTFSVVTNTGIGREVFITGSHPDAGGWNPTLGAKLVWTDGNVWTGSLAFAAGTQLDYKPVVLPNTVADICNGANWDWMPPGDGNHLTTNTAPQPAAPYAGKTVYYHSGFTNVTLIYSDNGGGFIGAPMLQAGPGRGPGEYLHLAEGIGTPGGTLEFVFSGMVGTNTYYDHAPYPGYGTPPDNNYFTTLDHLFVQDGDLFNYWPPTSLTPPQVLLSNAVSTFSPSPSRTMRIYLPRGYAENTLKRYPVLYMQDGENVFAPGGNFGSWDTDLIATRETSQGRMREVIIVALDSMPGPANRTREYLPPEDNEGGQGFGDVYANFLVHDVKTKIDAEFRTLPDRPNTLTAGSSSGGLITTYLGWSTNVFGKIGSFSPAYLISPNFNARIASEPKQALRIYTDMGTEGETEASLVADYWVVLDYLLRDGYVQHRDLLSWFACGATHNEAAWSARLPTALRFLLNPWDEPNRLAHRSEAPAIESATLDPGAATLRVAHPALTGWTYQVDAAATPAGPWTTNIAPSAPEAEPWTTRTVDLSLNPATTTRAYRILATAP